MLQLFSYTDELSKRTSQAVRDFQEQYRQFDFDAELLAPASAFVTRGKLFRGSLCLVTSQLLMRQATPVAGAWSAAVALELAGSAILIQDDVMDASEMRRDQPTLHRQYQKHWRGDATTASLFGESMSVCVSDTLFFWSSRLLTAADLPASVKLDLVAAMGLEIATLAMAQAEEMRFSALSLSDPTVNQESILKILIGKTARYTAAWPLRFAGIIAGADEPTTKALQEFGEAMGLVFQLSDDRLGLFGDPTKTGKDVDGDAKSGKKTLYALFARDYLTGESEQRFMELYGKLDLTAVELSELQQLLKINGIYDRFEAFTANQVEIAKNCLKKLEEYPELVAMLTQTVEFLATRQR